jgi:hypothetical protein
MENVGIFHVHLVYFTVIGNILRPFGLFCGHLLYFSPFWYVVPRKIWQSCWRVSKNRMTVLEIPAGGLSRQFASFNQVCQMVCFQTQNPTLGKIGSALE